MSDQNNDKINYTAADIQRYINGEMSAREMHNLESRALEDPFLADAIDGYTERELAADAGTANDLQEIYERLATRIATPHKTKIIPFFTTGWFKIAIMVLVIAGSSTLIYYLANDARSNNALVVTTREPGSSNNTRDSFTTTDITNSDSTAVALNQKVKDPPLFNPEKKDEPLKSSSTMNLPLEETSITPKKAPAAMLEKSMATNDSGNSAASLYKSEQNRQSASNVAKAPSVAGYGMMKKNKVFSGKVVDVQNRPVPNLVVSTRTGSKELDVKTDSNGVFIFSATDSVASVVIRKEGFEIARADLKSDSIAHDIKLKEAGRKADHSANTVGEVQSNRKASGLEFTPESAQNAVPVIGLPAFNEYIEKSKKITAQALEASGEVIVSFTVRKDGTLRNYIIKKSLSKQADNEAIRLIKEGPAWKLSRNREATATVTIKF